MKTSELFISAGWILLLGVEAAAEEHAAEIDFGSSQGGERFEVS